MDRRRRATAAAYGTTIATANNPTVPAPRTPFRHRDSNGNLVAGSFTFLVGQFDYTIGTVSRGDVFGATQLVCPDRVQCGRKQQDRQLYGRRQRGV